MQSSDRHACPCSATATGGPSCAGDAGADGGYVGITDGGAEADAPGASDGSAGTRVSFHSTAVPPLFADTATTSVDCSGLASGYVNPVVPAAMEASLLQAFGVDGGVYFGIAGNSTPDGGPAVLYYVSVADNYAWSFFASGETFGPSGTIPDVSMTTIRAGPTRPPTRATSS